MGVRRTESEDRIGVKSFKYNSSAQRDFILTKSRWAAYIGGLGSGKTFAGIARALKFAEQRKPSGALYGARGVIVASTYRVLQDVVLPTFFEMTYGTGLVKDFKASEMKVIMHNDAEILFRSADNPGNLRGPNLSWFFIDEGALVSRNVWNILTGRLRQPGFEHSGWVCSTPNGYDWMWQVFNPKSKARVAGTEWFNASTYENRQNVGEAFIEGLEANYEIGSPLYRQEVLGEFVGVLKGAVYPEFDRMSHVQPIEYNPELPIYTGWDFGIGDQGVCLFTQIDWQTQELSDGSNIVLPHWYEIDSIEAPDMNADDWADAFHEKRRESFENRMPEKSYGDPAGGAREGVTGKSMIDALNARGVPVKAARKRPPADAIQLLRPLMAASRFKIRDAEATENLVQAVVSHKWKVDDLGNRIGNEPVHDWTSHSNAARRYLAIEILTHFRSKRPRLRVPEAPPFSAEDLFWGDIKGKKSNWLGKSGRRRNKNRQYAPIADRERYLAAMRQRGDS